ncbi:hypothetical protein M3Y99_00876800 [Aphelenchoides fujianensis]|nr:hypothetical protein M3Y99_00876800 [Aphelenchoides fujianensis]
MRAAFGRECVCERKLKPVCGTDGQTYENMCQFECAKRLHAAISVQYGGSCCAPASLCPAGVYAPICDNFGSMHNNECLFEYNKCLAKKMYGVSLKVGAANKCAEFVPTNDTRLCEFECKDELDLVCDNLGQTHKNQCFFEQVICEQQLKKLPTASLIHKGRCNNGKYPKSSQRASSFGTPIQEFGQSGGAGEGNDAKLFFHQPDDPFINQNPYDLFVPATVETTAESSAASSPQPPMSTTITPWSTSNPAYTNKAPEQPEANPSTPEPFVPQTTGIPSTEFTDGAECSALNCNYKQWAPLCDTRNRTHRNACLFEFRVCKLKKMGATRNIPEIAYHGACSFGVMSQPSPNAVTQHSDVPPTSPLAREGFCRVCEEADGEVPIPVCDNANETHISACRLAQRNCEHRANGVEERVLVHVGICRNNSLVFTMENEMCPTTCSKNYKPVCASDGITHPNLCTFQMINCRQRKMKKPDPAWLVYLHECRQPERESEEAIGNENDDVENTQEVDVTSTTPFAPPETTTTANQSQLENFECPVPDCSAEEQPTVCDNEGTIHKSECMFTWARCVAARSGRTLHLVSDDECPANKCRLLESKVCTNEYNPICGSDFRVHPNDCFFEKARCADSELEEGKCCPSLDSCPLSSDPICDSRGRLHRNRCHFDVANCRSLKIERTAPAQVAPNANCSIMNLQHGIRSGGLKRKPGR